MKYALGRLPLAAAPDHSVELVGEAAEIGSRPRGLGLTRCHHTSPLSGNWAGYLRDCHVEVIVVDGTTIMDAEHRALEAHGGADH